MRLATSCLSGEVEGVPWGLDAGSRGLLRINPPRRYELGAPVVVDAYPPVLVVDQPVVKTAQHHQVVQCGLTAVGPVPHVVTVAGAGWAVAGGEGARAVPDFEGFAQVRWHNVRGTADVEGLTLPAEDERNHFRVAGEFADAVG